MESSMMDDYAKDVLKEMLMTVRGFWWPQGDFDERKGILMSARGFWSRCIAFLLRIINGSIGIRSNNAVHFGNKPLGAILCVTVYFVHFSTFILCLPKRNKMPQVYTVLLYTQLKSLLDTNINLSLGSFQTGHQPHQLIPTRMHRSTRPIKTFSIRSSNLHNGIIATLSTGQNLNNKWQLSDHNKSELPENKVVLIITILIIQ